TTGSSTATLATPGTYVPCPAASAATTASPGHYVSVSGAAAQTPAPPGFYMPLSGATSANAAPVGHYAPSEGMSAAIPAPKGSFVSSLGASSTTPAPAGYFVSATGASLATPAAPGTYVPTEGASAAIQAPPGTFVSASGASAATPAPPGYLVSVSGASSATAAPPGYYIPTSGATSALMASPGYYVSSSGSSAQIPAPLGYYIPFTGATAALSAAPGTYVPTAAATAALPCPPGTTSYVASAACRIVQKDHSCGLYTVGPNPLADTGDQMVATNLTGQAFYQIAVENSSQDMGGSSPLTRFTLVDAYFTGNDADYFSVDFGFPLTLDEGENAVLNFSAKVATNQSIHATLNLVTDQYASVGTAGETHLIHTVCLQSTAAADSDNDGLLDTEEALLGTRDDLADTDGDGYDDGFEAANPQMDPLVDDSDLVDFFQDERAMFDLYTATDIQEGSMGDLVLEPLGGGYYQFKWLLMSTTNLVEGIWDPVSTNQLLFTPTGADDTQLFRIRAGH
ncbi:MAG: hypothetical protein U9P12_00170, partial [Verrucomicrobiota bacterium]|nr:hypothetical protein [Verrucomicrobiota bacterium]